MSHSRSTAGERVKVFTKTIPKPFSCSFIMPNDVVSASSLLNDLEDLGIGCVGWSSAKMVTTVNCRGTPNNLCSVSAFVTIVFTTSGKMFFKQQ